mgnify:CR=1 FL=1|tara:strand:+ start:31 stop:282 length:252 start_codon:yes stop_codon:yes gene_type:complete
MVRHAILKQRINKVAWELKEFTANEVLHVLNNYPNMHGYGKTSVQVSIQRVANLLRGNKNVQYIPNIPKSKRSGKWKWVGDEE